MMGRTYHPPKFRPVMRVICWFLDHKWMDHRGCRISVWGEEKYAVYCDRCGGIRGVRKE